MRLSRADLRRRYNSDLSIRYQARGLTSYAGLELLRRYFGQLGLMQLVRSSTRRWLPSSDYGAVSMLLLLMTLVVTGGRRIRHVGYLESDPVVKRLCGLERVPRVHTVRRWLNAFDAQGVEALLGLNASLTGRVMRERGLRRLTLDIDGTVVSTGLQVQGARRGFNPHRRKVPSDYPIRAYEANSGQVVRVGNRAGNVHDGKASLGVVQELFAQLERTFEGQRPVVEMRMDGAFFRADVLERLCEERVEYAIKVPFYPWLELKERVAARQRWSRVGDRVECFELRKHIAQWGRTERIVMYRRRVHHRTEKNFQLDLFDPDDGYYEYSAVATNKAVTGRTLWYFMCGRGTHEKVYGELKNGFAFDCVPSQRFEANSAWQVVSVIVFNLTRGFQALTTAPVQAANRKRRTLSRFEHIQTLRYRFLNRAGLLIRPNGRPTLDVGDNPLVRERFESIDTALAIAA